MSDTEILALILGGGVLITAIVALEIKAPKQYRISTMLREIFVDAPKRRKRQQFQREVVAAKNRQEQQARQELEAQSVTPPSIPQRKPPPIIAEAANTHGQKLNELLKHKKRWDKLESGLRNLRESMQIEGRINKEHKAEMILQTESGADLLAVIRERFPQYLYRERAAQKSGCLSVLVLILVPVGLVVAGACWWS